MGAFYSINSQGDLYFPVGKFNFACQQILAVLAQKNSNDGGCGTLANDY